MSLGQILKVYNTFSFAEGEDKEGFPCVFCLHEGKLHLPSQYNITGGVSLKCLKSRSCPVAL